MNYRISFVLFLLLWLLGCTSNITEHSKQLTSISVQLGTTHQALYAGFYVAVQKGYYEREGLDVTLLEGGTTIDLTENVVNGTAQFGAMGASALILERADNQPVQAIATILRRDPVVFFSLGASNITKLEDFIGKRVQASIRLQPRLHAMLGYAGIDPEEIIQVNTGGLTELYNGEIDVASGLITSSVLSAREAGYEVNVIFPDDYGVHFYSVVLFTTDELIETQPDMVLSFLRATLDGWTYSIENPQEIGPIVALYKDNVDIDFETNSMISFLPYINTGEDYIGWMKPETWDGMANTMHEQGELNSPLIVDEVYTMQFIEAIYQDD